ncbi:MAG: phytase [Crocosphaera sp.]
MIRFATFNASLNRNSEGELIADLTTLDNPQAQTVAEIIQRVNADVILINELDFDSENEAVELFNNNYLNVSQNGVNPVDYPYFYVAPSNTGIPSGFDLDNNGSVVTTPGQPGYGNDAFGFGNFPGQFGMAVYSKYPINFENIRTFQTFLWKDMPGALLPVDPDTGASFYSPEELEVFRLSSKSHWDLPIMIDGETVHFLVSHPTPPVFDGPEDRNGTRNHDEIRFWADYVTPENSGYIYDDEGTFGGLKAGEKFVIAGDQNADPFDGDSVNGAINQLLENPQINTVMTPASDGGVDASIRQGNINNDHQGDPAFDTADFNDNNPGNLRVDYVLPSENLEVTDSGVFWPTSDDSLFDLVGNFPFPSSDHRLVYTDVNLEKSMINSTRKTVTDLNFIGEVSFDTGFTFEDTEFGGISGLTYDENNDLYYAFSDDRSQRNDARFYNLDIDLSDGSLDANDINIASFTTLLNEAGEPFAENEVDPEGIVLTSGNTLFISSEGNANILIDPFVNEFSLSGQQVNSLPVPNKFLPTADQSSGIRNNQAFESLTITPDERYLYTAVENALWQDGINSTLEDESAVRILQYDLTTGNPGKEFLYFTDTIPSDSNPPGGFADNGLVELLALDNTGTFLSLERSFSSGVGNSIRLYEVRSQGATDISEFDSLAIDPTNPNDGLFDVDAVAEKRLLLDFDDLGIRLDNSEALAFGPTLPNGKQSLIVASDNNFNGSQISQFLAFELDINSIPAVTPTLETPNEIRYDDPSNPNVIEGSDSDDPAIYVHPTDVEQSLVITALKNGGLAVYDLDGQELQKIVPDNIRYNNVDLIYGFNLDGDIIDIAVVSDRRHDTLAIFQIDPTTQQLTDITSPNILESIFGVDDGEATAYGLATYTSPVTGKVYSFVSQADGNQVAQLELVSDGENNITAEIVRTISVPIPPESDLEDAQVEGMVVDRELGYLYVGQEEFGIWKFLAEPDSSNTGTIIDTVKDINPNSNLTADVEGLTIYYGEDGNGYLLASSQGDSSFAVYERGASNSYLGNFVVGEDNGVDGVEESDGADIINVALGDKFPHGLLVVQDGSNEEATVFQDPEDGEIQNFNTNFKYIDLEDLSNTLPFFELDTETYNPRNPTPNSNVPKTVFGTPEDDVVDTEDPQDSQFIGDAQNLFMGSGNDIVDVTFAPGGNRIDLGSGNDLLFAGTNNRIIAGSGDDTIFVGSAGGDNVITGGSGKDQFWIVTDAVDLPTAANIITDFEIGEDAIGFATTDLSFADVDLIQEGNNTIIHALEKDLAILRRIESTDLSASDFVFNHETQSENPDDIPMVAETVSDDNSVEEEVISEDEIPNETFSSNNIDSIEELSSEINEVVSLFQSDNEGELYDLRSFSEQVITVDFVVTRSANYNNYVGFYEIDDLTGIIEDLTPGDVGYTEAALLRQVPNLGLQTNNKEMLTVSSTLNGGSLYAPFIVVNDTPDSLEDLSSVYFPFLGANSDNRDRVRLLDNNVFGFEDKSDFDYNDLIVTAEFSVATV